MAGEKTPRAIVHQWLADSLSSDVRRVIERWAGTENVGHIAVMPDVHLAEDLCIGCVIASKRWIFPGAVGNDIGCGMTAVRFDGSVDVLGSEDAAGAVMERLYREIPAQRHSRRDAGGSSHGPEVRLSSPDLVRVAHEDGRLQFGTLGGGNHFVELQADEADRLWLMVHSGSRGVGQAIARHHDPHDGENVPPGPGWRSPGGHPSPCRRAETGIRYLEVDSVAGQAYLRDAAWAVSYAAASRRAMVDAVARIMGDLFGLEIDESALVDCPHNFVRQEEHAGEIWWVHRKGAISALAGEPGVVPGSMGTSSYHVTGRGLEESLCSSAHGAGRALSRTDARRKISAKTLRDSMRGIWYDHRKIDTLVDEAPAAYKDIGAVMRAQRELVRVERRLRPVLNYKGVR